LFLTYCVHRDVLQTVHGGSVSRIRWVQHQLDPRADAMRRAERQSQLWNVCVNGK